MALDLGSIGNIFKGYATNGVIILLIVFLFAIGGFLIFGYFNRKSKLKYNCIELVRFGNGKIGMNLMKAGYFKNKSFLKLFDYGRELYAKTSDGRVIEKAKTSHLHDIMGKKGFVTMRSTRDPKILVPISKVDFDNLDLLFEIAPADYRDASVRIYREAVDETKGLMDKIMPYIAIGLCIMLCLITVIICMQMTNNATQNVGKILIQGCSNVANVKTTGG